MLFGGFGGAVERWPADFRGSLWTACVDAPTLVHDLTQRRSQGRAFLGGRRGGGADPSEVAAVAAVAGGGR